MKHIRKISAFLLTTVMLVMLMVPAMAATVNYAKVSPSIPTLGLKEKLEVTEAGAKNPLVQYTLTLGNIQAYTDSGVIYGDITKVENASGVNGKTMTHTAFAANAITGVDNKTEYYNDSALVTAINALVFDRPGIYYWKITKSSSAPTVPELSNYNYDSSNDDGTALLIRVDDDGTGILVPTIGIVKTDNSGKPTIDTKIDTYVDKYPVKPGTITLQKTVTGNQGEKDRYFEFTVELTGMAGFTGTTLTLDVTDGNSVASVAAAKYGEFTGTKDNTQAITVDGSGNATATFWLKHDEKVEISGIPNVTGTTGGASYKITETSVTGYTTKYKVTGGNTVTETEANNTDTRILQKAVGDTVTFTNNKESTPPTGILLSVGAPVAGLAVAGALIGVTVAGKRKRESEDAE